MLIFYITIQIIHWIAELTKDEPNFSDVDSDDDAAENDQGAVYNDFDRTESFLDIHDILKCNLLDENPLHRNEFDVTEDIIPEKSVELAVLTIDRFINKNPVENPPYLYFSNINSEDYQLAVFMLLMGGWKKFSFSTHLQDFYLARCRHNWGGTDSLYDAWLLSYGKRRPEFDMDIFTDSYPLWEARVKERYT